MYMKGCLHGEGVYGRTRPEKEEEKGIESSGQVVTRSVGTLAGPLLPGKTGRINNNTKI